MTTIEDLHSIGLLSLNELLLEENKMELTTVSINNKLLDVYYSIHNKTEIKIESVEVTRDTTNILDFLNATTLYILNKEVKTLHMEFIK